MAKLDLGKVVGNDAGFGNVVAFVENDGGEPGVLVETDGDDRSKDFTFTFKNLSPDPLSSNEISQVIDSNQMLSTSSTLTGTGLSTLYQKLKEKFAALIHTHKASDITEGTFNIARIADNSIGTEKFTQSVRDSLSQDEWEGTNGVSAVKNGKSVTVYWNNPSTNVIPSQESTTIAILPERFRPRKRSVYSAITGDAQTGRIFIETNGQIKAFVSSATQTANFNETMNFNQ